MSAKCCETTPLLSRFSSLESADSKFSDWAMIEKVAPSRENVRLVFLIGPNADKLRAKFFLSKHSAELCDKAGNPLFPTGNATVISNLTARSLHRDINLVGQLRSMQNIVSLELYMDDTPFPTFDIVVYLLKQWKQTLQELKFCWAFGECLTGYFYLTNENPIEKLSSLLSTINHLPVLEVLKLHFVEIELKSNKPLYLPIISRLKEFHFSSLDEKPKFLYDSLMLAEHNQSLSVAIFNAYFHPKDISPKFAKKCITLPPIALPKKEDLANLSKMLSPSVKLQQLIFFANANSITATKFRPKSQISALPSVLLVVLHTAPKYHNGLSAAHWHNIFPSLQVVELHLKRFYPCFKMGSAPRCLLATIKPFFRCAHLRKIFIHLDGYPNEIVCTVDTKNGTGTIEYEPEVKNRVCCFRRRPPASFCVEFVITQIKFQNKNKGRSIEDNSKVQR